MTIVGAGTVTCPILEEQANSGNNFNLLDFDLDRNELSVRLYQADPEGVFRTPAAVKKFPLFRTQPLGYSMREIRKIADVGADGGIRTKIIKRDLRVEQEEKEVHYVDLHIRADSIAAEISDFQPQSTGAKFKADVVEAKRIEGRWFLERPLRRGSPPISLLYSYVLRKGAAMTKSKYRQFRGKEGDYETTSITIKNPADKLLLELQLPSVPKRFETEPGVEVEHLGQKILPVKLGCRTHFDDLANRYVLEVDNPPQDHTFSIVWRLPEKWVWE